MGSGASVVLALGNLCPAERPIASTLILLLKEGFCPRSLPFTRARLVGGVFRTKVPSICTLLCKSGFGLKLQSGIHNALIGTVLSFDQVLSCTLLEQASGF
jgi:hypothetical protein